MAILKHTLHYRYRIAPSARPLLAVSFVFWGFTRRAAILPLQRPNGLMRPANIAGRIAEYEFHGAKPTPTHTDGRQTAYAG
jgi:hypothetical protein